MVSTVENRSTVEIVAKRLHKKAAYYGAGQQPSQVVVRRSQQHLWEDFEYGAHIVRTAKCGCAVEVSVVIRDKTSFGLFAVLR